MSWVWLPLAGIWAMDRRTAFNFMLSRPIVVAGIIGLINGHFFWCILGGAIFEVIGLLDLPVGTRESLDDTFGAFCYAILISQTTAPSVELSILAALISFFLIFPVGMTFLYVRWLNLKLFDYYNEKGIENVEGKVIMLGQAMSFLRGVVVYSVCTLIALSFYNILSENINLPSISPFNVIMITFLTAGYFIGFFHSKLRNKFIFLFSGGILACLLF